MDLILYLRDPSNFPHSLNYTNPFRPLFKRKPNRIIQIIVSFLVQHQYCSSLFFDFYNTVLERPHDLAPPTRLINTMLRAWTKLSFLCQASNVIHWNARVAFGTTQQQAPTQREKT
jgi:hypothetical protein